MLFLAKVDITLPIAFINVSRMFSSFELKIELVMPCVNHCSVNSCDDLSPTTHDRYHVLYFIYITICICLELTAVFVNCILCFMIC